MGGTSGLGLSAAKAFVAEGANIKREISSMPDVFQLSIDNVLRECEEGPKWRQRVSAHGRGKQKIQGEHDVKSGDGAQQPSCVEILER